MNEYRNRVQELTEYEHRKKVKHFQVPWKLWRGVKGKFMSKGSCSKKVAKSPSHSLRMLQKNVIMGYPI